MLAQAGVVEDWGWIALGCGVVGSNDLFYITPPPICSHRARFLFVCRDPFRPPKAANLRSKSRSAKAANLLSKSRSANAIENDENAMQHVENVTQNVENVTQNVETHLTGHAANPMV